MTRPGQDTHTELFEPLVQYLAGRLDDEAAAALREAYGSTPRGTSILDSALAALREESAEHAVDTETMARRLAVARAQIEQPRAVNRPHPTSHPFRRWPLAAAIAVMAVIGLMLQSHGRGVSFLSSTRTYRAPAGQRATLTFADGSRAQLGPMTTLIVTNRSTHRQIDVMGEAFFTVVHHPNTSFQVRTTNTLTRVLGTTFLVRRYPNDRVTHVVVADGRVAVSGSSGNNASILTTRMLGAVDDSGHIVVTPNIGVENYTVWTTGQLVFQDSPMGEVITELSRAYDVELRIADSTLAKRHLTWTVPLSRYSLTGILDALSTVLDAHPVRVGRVITFVPGQSASHRFPELHSSTSERQYGK